MVIEIFSSFGKAIGGSIGKGIGTCFDYLTNKGIELTKDVFTTTRGFISRNPLISIAFGTASGVLLTAGLMGYFNSSKDNVVDKKDKQTQEQKVDSKDIKYHPNGLDIDKLEVKIGELEVNVRELEVNTPKQKKGLEDKVDFTKVLPSGKVYTLRLDNDEVCKIKGHLSNPKARYHFEAIVEDGDFSSLESTAHSDIYIFPHGVYQLREEIDGQLHDIGKIDAKSDTLKAIYLKETVRPSNKQLEEKTKMLDKMFEGNTGIYDNSEVGDVVVPEGYEIKPHPYDRGKSIIAPQRGEISVNVPYSVLNPNDKFKPFNGVRSKRNMSVITCPNEQPILFH